MKRAMDIFTTVYFFGCGVYAMFAFLTEQPFNKHVWLGVTCGFFMAAFHQSQYVNNGT